MADRTLVQNYIFDAQAAAGTDIAAQIAWLHREHREPLSKAVNGGDIEVTGRTFEGVTSQTKQRIDAKTRLGAVLAAIDQLQSRLNGTASTQRASVILPRFKGILS